MTYPSSCENDIRQPLAASEAVEIGGEVAPAAVGGALSKPQAMRRHQHVRQFVKRKPRRAPVGMLGAPMLPPDIKRRTSEAIAAQGGVKRLLVHDCSTADIDQQCSRFHQR